MNFQAVDVGSVSETEMHSRVVRRCEAATAQNIPTLPYPSSGYENRGTRCIAWRLTPPDKTKFDPVMIVRANVAQQSG